MASITTTTGETPVSWRERIDFNRTTVFGLVFLIAGIIMAITIPISHDGAARSAFSFPHDTDSLDFTLNVPTMAFGVATAIIYIVTGAYALFFPARDERQARWKTWGLFLDGALIIPVVMALAAAGKETNMVSMLSLSFRLGTPIVIGAMAGIWCERSGVVNIAIEGMMLTGAAFGFTAFTLVSDSISGQSGIWIGVGVSVLCGGVMALIHAWLSITFKTDQIISGTVINILALGLTSFIRDEILLENESARETLQPIDIPVLSELPIVGEVFFAGKPIFFLMFVLVIFTHVVLYFTRWGLRTRAVGENPHAADTVGIEVVKNRYINVVVGGLIAGLAGAWFSLETSGSFDENMTRGLGFIALAAMIFGKWTPLGAMGGGILFGFSRALESRFQTLEVDVPVDFLRMTPYIVTMIVLAGLVGRAIAPKAIGLPYEKE